MVNVFLYFAVPALGLLAALILVYEVAKAIRHDWRQATAGSELLRVYDQDPDGR